MLELRNEMKCDISIICEKVMSVIRIPIVVCLTTWSDGLYHELEC